ncbi:hypothetical protein AAES_10225 [Amazona aestiva]|uniref:Uncharacterized protein n=1 Tax=Amazona aestiva TaxID=12930 RepID=A0A0Q3X5R1_AMAAE|nr:hypothetical protein AAES_10225 [Amazona aestiva]
MSDMAGSVADGVMASKAVEVGQRVLHLCESKFGEILNSYKVSNMAGLQETKKPDWRRSVGVGDIAQKQLRCLLEIGIHNSKIMK